MATSDPQKPHVSVSQLSKYRLCPRQWYYHYVARIPSQMSDNLAIGIAMHEGVEHNLRQKTSSGVDCPADDSKEVAIRALRGAIEKGFTSANGLSENDMEQQVIGLVGAHHRFVAPKIEPAFVEYEFRIDLGEGFPVDLLGYIDCITQDGLILDVKSWGKAKGQNYADKDMQLTAYAFAYRSIFQRPEKGLRFDAIIKRGFRYEPIETKRDNLQIRWFLRQLEEIVAGMRGGPDSFWPNDDTYLCDPRYCDYWTQCHEELV